jgi:hypothetical protein
MKVLTHTEAEALLHDPAHTLTAPVREALTAHLTACESCTAYADQLARLQPALRTMLRSDPGTPITSTRALTARLIDTSREHMMKTQILRLSRVMAPILALAGIIIISGVFDPILRALSPTHTEEISLIENPGFDEEPPLAGWLFYNDRFPSGGYELIRLEGRTAAGISRSQADFPGVQLSHAETGFVQRLTAYVEDYSLLELRANFKIEEQSLPHCGEQGSECPLMLHLRYMDTQGITRDWYQGFYAVDDPTLGYPDTCLACRRAHQQVQMHRWSIYESGNLFDLLPADQRPARIIEVSFYASGWAYVVYVSEFNLIAAP